MSAYKDRFVRSEGKWYIVTEEGRLGPYADKADAQLALLFYSQRLSKPSEKQLRSFMGTDSHELRRSMA